MGLLEKIEADFLSAYKEKNENAVSVLRLLKSALKNESINKKGELSEAEAEKVIKSEIKKRQDAVVDYEKGGRQELADKEKSEVDFLTKYLPQQMTAEEIAAKIDAIIVNADDSVKNNFGKLMGLAMKELGSAADGNLVKKIIEEKLNK